MNNKITKAVDVLKEKIPFEYEDLTVCVAAASSLLRTKVRQAFDGYDVEIFETANMEELIIFAESFKPKIVILGFRFFGKAEFPGEIAALPRESKPRFVLTGTQQELESDRACKGVDGLLCLPFLPEMLLLKVSSLLMPSRDWSAEEDLLLRKMRKYQRFVVTNVTVIFHKPVQERTKVLDLSYQGIKAVSEALTQEHVGETFRMQISCEGAYVLLEARLMWVREGQVGFRFCRDRPRNFEDFFRDVIAMAVGID